MSDTENVPFDIMAKTDSMQQKVAMIGIWYLDVHLEFDEEEHETPASAVRGASIQCVEDAYALVEDRAEDIGCKFTLYDALSSYPDRDEALDAITDRAREIWEAEAGR